MAHQKLNNQLGDSFPRCALCCVCYVLCVMCLWIVWIVWWWCDDNVDVCRRGVLWSFVWLLVDSGKEIREDGEEGRMRAKAEEGASWCLSKFVGYGDVVKRDVCLYSTCMLLNYWAFEGIFFCNMYHPTYLIFPSGTQQNTRSRDGKKV